MKIAILSDSHDNIPNIENFLSWARDNDIDTIIHCGDLASPDMIKQVLIPKFKGEIHLVHGNVSDRDYLEEVCDELDNVTLHGDIGYLEIEGIKIAFCHFPEQAQELAKSGKYSLVFYGHTHKPWIEKVGNTSVSNPGTLGGLFQRASFASYDTSTKNLELIILDDI